jgi:hypothetical protein
MIPPQFFMELWELLNADTWSRFNIADDGKGLITSPHSSKAKRFSLLGGLIHCYIPKNQLWTYEFETMRSTVFAALVTNKTLRNQLKDVMGHTSLSKIPLQELNSLVTWTFINSLLSTIKIICKK